MWEAIGAAAVVGGAVLLVALAFRHATRAVELLGRSTGVPVLEAAPLLAAAAAQQAAAEPIFSPEERARLLKRLDLVLERLHREVVELRAALERNGQ